MATARPYTWGLYSRSGKLLMKFYFKKYAVSTAKCFRTKVTVRRLKEVSDAQ